MLFNSLAFLVFLPIAFGVYWSAHRNLRAQNLVVLALSYLFYGWWDWRFLGLIVLSSAIDFTVGLGMNGTSDRRRKLLLGVSLGVNLGLLGFFLRIRQFLPPAGSGPVERAAQVLPQFTFLPGPEGFADFDHLSADGAHRLSVELDRRLRGQ